MSTLFQPEAPPVAGSPIQPVTILIEREHAFKKRKPDEETGKKRIGCEVCREGRLKRQHLGAPPSMNAGGSGLKRMEFQAIKGVWQAFILELLQATDLPTGLAAVMVEGRVCFPDRARRDQGNFRWMIEKAAGDALVEGGYLEEDSWDFYEFGNLQRTYMKGRSSTELIFFPRA